MNINYWNLLLNRFKCSLDVKILLLQCDTKQSLIEVSNGIHTYSMSVYSENLAETLQNLINTHNG